MDVGPRTLSRSELSLSLYWWKHLDSLLGGLRYAIVDAVGCVYWRVSMRTRHPAMRDQKLDCYSGRSSCIRASVKAWGSGFPAGSAWPFIVTFNAISTTSRARLHDMWGTATRRRRHVAITSDRKCRKHGAERARSGQANLRSEVVHANEDAPFNVRQKGTGTPEFMVAIDP